MESVFYGQGVGVHLKKGNGVAWHSIGTKLAYADSSIIGSSPIDGQGFGDLHWVSIRAATLSKKLLFSYSLAAQKYKGYVPQLLFCLQKCNLLLASSIISCRRIFFALNKNFTNNQVKEGSTSASHEAWVEWNNSKTPREKGKGQRLRGRKAAQIPKGNHQHDLRSPKTNPGQVCDRQGLTEMQQSGGNPDTPKDYSTLVWFQRYNPP